MIGGLNKDAIVQDSQVIKPRGRVSTIFTGREAILGKIRTYFRRHEFGDIYRKEHHIWGMGGVGKTQIALKFAEEFEQDKYVRNTDEYGAQWYLELTGSATEYFG